MAATMLAVRTALSGVALLAAGTVAGLVAFGVTLSVLGIEPRDRRLVGGLFEQYRDGDGVVARVMRLAAG
jgi:hypothetical protein